MSKLGWCMTGHHSSCPVETISGVGCDCTCHVAVPEESDACAADDSNAEQLTFGADGVWYEIDLSTRQASRLGLL